MNPSHICCLLLETAPQSAKYTTSDRTDYHNTSPLLHKPFQHAAYIVCCDSGLSRLTIVARPSRGSELCAGSGGPYSERRLGAAALWFLRVGPALSTGAFSRLEPALQSARVPRGLSGCRDYYLKAVRIRERSFSGGLSEDSGGGERVKLGLWLGEIVAQ
jgi:hypothetical protein